MILMKMEALHLTTICNLVFHDHNKTITHQEFELLEIDVMKSSISYIRLFIIFICLTSETPILNAEESHLKVIPRIDVRGQTAADAIESIQTQYKKTYPSSAIYDSSIICSDYSAKKHISLSLTNVPLEVALNTVAESLGLRAYYKENKFILIEDNQIQDTYFAARMTDDVIEGLNITRPLSQENLVNALHKAKIDISYNNEIRFDVKQEFVRIQISYDESQKLKALFELLNRGMRLNHK